MRQQTPQQLALCSWSLRAKTPAELVDSVRQTGLDKVQLALGPLMKEADVWGSAPQQLQEAGISIISGMIGMVGENYSSLESIRRTGGFVPDETWDENWANICESVKLARSLKICDISTHAGFLPHDPKDPSFEKLVDRVTRIAGRFSELDMNLLFETGQETADTLSSFLGALKQIGVHNVFVNFDPANMILYDKGEPVVALRKLMPLVKQVHIKDAVRTEQPGTWGRELAVGQGEVPWPQFLAALAEGDYAGHLVIEREAGAERVADIRAAAEHLKNLMS